MGKDFVKCPICGHRGQRIYKHIKKQHGLSVEEFAKLYPNCPTTCESLKKQIRSKTKDSKNTPEAIEARKILMESEEWKAIASRNGKKTWEKEGFREMMSEQMTETAHRCWSDEEWKAETSKKIREALNTDRVRNMHNTRLKKQWQDPEYREKMSQMAIGRLKSGEFGTLRDFVKSDGTTVQYRSKNEFYVACFLEMMGLEFEYETQSFTYHGEDNLVHKYLVDFYIPGHNLFLEVKMDWEIESEETKLKVDSVHRRLHQIVLVNEHHSDSLDHYEKFQNLIKDFLYAKSSSTITSNRQGTESNKLSVMC
jgi:hypothetical protein